MSEDNEYITFRCTGDPECCPRSWEGTIRILRMGAFCEAEIKARGSLFHLIVGQHKYGNFVCIPNWDIGTELAGLDDIFWNTEHLLDHTALKIVDACSVAAALCRLKKYVGSQQQAKRGKYEVS